jgi:hypothetical protein
MVGFEHAELKFVGSGGRIAGVNVSPVDQLITPDSGVYERARDSAADSAGVILDGQFAQR